MCHGRHVGEIVDPGCGYRSTAVWTNATEHNGMLLWEGAALDPGSAAEEAGQPSRDPSGGRTGGSQPGCRLKHLASPTP